MSLQGIMSYDATVSTPLANGTVVNTTVLKYAAIGGGAHHLGADVTPGCGVFCEILFTMIIVIPYLLTLVDRKSPAGPLVVGVGYIVGVLSG